MLYLASYAMGAFDLRLEERFDFGDADTVVEAFAAALVAAARRAFGRGLLHGYRTEEEALHTVRGRIVVAEQIRRRFDLLLPVEVRYDEFTDDILANRLVKAAAAQLGSMRLRSRETRRRLGWVAATLDNVSLVEFAPQDVPEVKFDRLNAHYREVVELSRARVLRYRAFETDRGGMRANGFLMDMNVVFQEFVTVALRENRLAFPRVSSASGTSTALDEAGRVGLRPDLVWREGSSCLFVGRCQVQEPHGRAHSQRRPLPVARLRHRARPAGRAADLRTGWGEDDVTPIGPHASKRLEIAAVDLSGTIDDILQSVDALAGRVKSLREEARRVRRAA